MTDGGASDEIVGAGVQKNRHFKECFAVGQAPVLEIPCEGTVIDVQASGEFPAGHLFLVKQSLDSYSNVHDVNSFRFS